MFGIIGLAVLSGLGHRYSHPARMLAFVNFQPIPDAESLPFHLLVLKLVVCVCVEIAISYPIETSIH